MKSWKTN